MSNEATIRSSLAIRKESGDLVTIQYSGQPTAFLGDVTGTKGPVPGAVACSTAGTDIDLSELTTPGYCRIMNQDPTNYVTVGIYDPETTTFYPMLELLPGETYVMRLSRNLAWEYGTAAGTGTTGPETNRLRIKAHTASCNVLVEAFET